MPHACGWIIDKDHLFEEGEDDAGGTMGPGDGTEDLAAMTVPFRLFDDDGNLYYEGRMTPKCFDHFGDCDPLYAFGMPNAGATDLQYLEAGEWKSL